MARLTPALQRSRLAFDYRTTRALVAPALGAVRAYRAEDDLRARREVTPDDGAAGQAVLYVVEYRLPVLVGPDTTVPAVTVRFNLLDGGNYPYSTPAAAVTSRPTPWSPHVHPATGLVCLGEGWPLAAGRMLFAQLVVHVLRLLNCDEPDRDPSYVGWNAAAIHYWRTVLHRRPLHPDLEYPRLPAELTHRGARVDATFRPVGEAAPVFAPDDFRPADAADEDADEDTDADVAFVPLWRVS